MEPKLAQIKNEALSAVQAAASVDQIKDIEIRFLGKKGELTVLMQELRNVSADERPLAGKRINDLKVEITAAIESKKSELSTLEMNRALQSEWLDYTLPSQPMRATMGALHPITQIQLKVESIFKSMGFLILDGPHVETEQNNFDGLNIPATHPARDMQDTFWTDDGFLLRTHTSAVQVRGMKKLKPPFRAIAPGRVFRNEATDASHENTFYQIEGLVIDRDVSLANLTHAMKVLIDQVMECDSVVRLRPGYFPFVEPGFELDMQCRICQGKGCSVCKQVGWVEVLPCGLVHPNVLKAGGIDPTEFSGYAFGLGLDRLVMMKYGIRDIRYFHSGDLNFLRQFI